MNSAGWIDIWHIAGAMLARQAPFVQILAVTLAALFVVMAVEGFRTSLIAIWRGHRSAPMLVPRAKATAMTPFAAPASKSFSFRPVSPAAPKRKALTANPRQFRTPRPTIRRHPALDSAVFAAPPQYAADTPEETAGAI
jgi:hypothetical protein